MLVAEGLVTTQEEENKPGASRHRAEGRSKSKWWIQASIPLFQSAFRGREEGIWGVHSPSSLVFGVRGEKGGLRRREIGQTQNCGYLETEKCFRTVIRMHGHTMHASGTVLLCWGFE